jgi:uncharacterized protein YjeT (DUF2065 family)
VSLIAPTRLRPMTLGLGVGTIVFGLVPFVFPRFFAKAFDLPMTESPAADVVIRSVSARDVISGIGILSAVMHGGRVGPWLLARTLTDATDTLAITIAWLAGARSLRLFALGAIAVGATAVDVVLYLAHKSEAARSGPTS